MLEVLKEKVGEDCKRWSTLIAESPDKCTTIELTKVFNILYSRSIINIAFGEDISQERMSLLCRKSPHDHMEEKEMTFGEAINLTFFQAFETIVYKSSNVLFRAIYAYTGKSVSFSTFER